MSNLREAAEQALKYFEDAYGLEDTEVAIKEALRQALAEPELKHRTGDCLITGICAAERHKIYTAPPKREWVGLTDEELSLLWLEYHGDNFIADGRIINYEKAIEAKLKEKNGEQFSEKV